MPEAPIKLVDLQRPHAALKDELSGAIARVVASGRYLLGPEVAAFEAEFAAHEGAPHGVACGSGSDAIYLALRALEIGPGQTVVTAANSFVATAESIARTGASVRFAEPDPRSENLNPADLARLLQEPGADRITAVVPVHLHGLPADLTGIRAVLDRAGRSNVLIVADAAQAHGSRQLAALALISTYSFYPAKNLGAMGDGGMVLCHDPALAARLRSLRNHGRASKHTTADVGLNSRFDAIQAAVLRVKLPSLRGWNAQRREQAARYRELLAHRADLRLPVDTPDHVYHHYSVHLGVPRDPVVARLKAARIETGLHYPVPVHRMGPYPSPRALPITERLASTQLSLPIFPGLRGDEQQRVAAVLCQALDEAVASDPNEASP